MDDHVKLSGLVQGGVQEQFNKEWDRVIRNIDDPNTSATAARSITITITLKPDKKRKTINSTIATKSTIAPDNPLDTTFVMGADSAGNVVSKELMFGDEDQTFFDNEGTVRTGTGEPVDQDTGEIKSGDGNVVNFR
ncbi:replication terminator protein [Paenibacillus polymyxa]|uniref:replication terminator protein n=1 Tax=Paenibacillus polymyxa TaxID=1406 RepID=UPI002ED607A5|nr:replication terminator protein [Paenibacillus polymyxa]